MCDNTVYIGCHYELRISITDCNGDPVTNLSSQDTTDFYLTRGPVMEYNSEVLFDDSQNIGLDSDLSSTFSDGVVLVTISDTALSGMQPGLYILKGYLTANDTGKRYQIHESWIKVKE